jgi:nucleotide-binding universal stress UspA family protein
MSSYRTVVVGTDGSETAQLAVRHAGKVAADNEARLVVVTAYEPQGDELVNKEGQAPEDIRWALTDRVQAEELANKGRAIAKEQGATGIVAQAIPGSPADVLLEAAQDFDADVIIVGSKGLTSSVRFVLGSVASSVSHHAPCDVLIVHTTD